MSPLDWRGWLPPNTALGTHRLLGSMDERGSLVGLPLWFNSGRQVNPAEGTSPCSRYLFLGFEGESHPWNPKAWNYAKTAIKDMVDIVATRCHLVVEGIEGPTIIEPDQKQLTFTAKLFSPLSTDADIEMQVRGRDTGKLIYSETKRVHFNGGISGKDTQAWVTVPFTIENPQLASDWAYEVSVSAIPVGQKRCYPAYDENIFVKRDAGNAKSAPVLAMGPGKRYMTFDGKPWWGFGFNGGSVDVRTHFAPTSFLGPIDRQNSEMKAMHGDNLRTFFWAMYYGPNLEKDNGSLYAYNSLMARTGILNEVGYFQQTQNEWKHDPAIAAIWDKEDPWVGPTWSYIYDKFNRRFNEETADFKNILIYPYNENCYFHAQGLLPDNPKIPFLEWAENMERFNLNFDNTVKKASGYDRVTCSEMGSVVYPFQTPNVGEDPLDLTSYHIYGNECARYLDNKTDLAFTLNYGKPCWIGESMSMEGGWQDNLFGIFMAEMGAGISFHTYRGDGWPWWSRWDEVYTERCIQTKMWGLLLKHIAPSDYTPLDTILLFDDREDLRAAGESGFPVDGDFDAKDRIETRGSGPDKARASRLALDKQYNELLARGIYTQIQTPESLAKYPGKIKNIVLATNFVTSPRGIEIVNRLTASGVRVYAGGSAVPDGMKNVKPFSETAALERKDVKYDGAKPQYFYVRDRVDGGKTIIMTGASGKYTFTVDGRTKIGCEVPDGRSLVLDLSPKEAVMLYKGYGSLTVNGKPVATAQMDPDLAYLVFSRDKKPISTSNLLTMFCEDQSAVKLAHQPANAVAGLKQAVIVYSRNDYKVLAERIAESLAKKGVVAKVRSAADLSTTERSSNIIVVGADTKGVSFVQKIMAGKKGIRQVNGWHNAPVFIGKARLNWLYDGFISTYSNPWNPETRAVVIGGVNVPGLKMAVQRFEHLSLLGDYSTGIFSPQDH